MNLFLFSQQTHKQKHNHKNLVKLASVTKLSNHPRLGVGYSSLPLVTLAYLQLLQLTFSYFILLSVTAIYLQLLQLIFS